MNGRSIRKGVSAAGAGRSKYGNVPTVIDNYRFDSKAEAARYSELKLRQNAKEIEQLTVHPTYPLYVQKLLSYQTEKVGTYEADFEYVEKINGEWKRIVEDVKGVKTALYRLKKKIMKVAMNIDVVEVPVRSTSRSTSRKGARGRRPK